MCEKERVITQNSFVHTIFPPRALRLLCMQHTHIHKTKYEHFCDGIINELFTPLRDQSGDKLNFSWNKFHFHLI